MHSRVAACVTRYTVEEKKAEALQGSSWYLFFVSFVPCFKEPLRRNMPGMNVGFDCSETCMSVKGNRGSVIVILLRTVQVKG